jgi:molecular chaperone DnaK
VQERIVAKTKKNIDSCVIAVPAYFNELQRTSTKIAAEIACINVVKIINEPTAAALAYQHKNEFENGTVVVFDFGGGTLDVSILMVKGNRFAVLAVAGNTELGGEDIDALLVKEMLSRFYKKHPELEGKVNKRSLALLKQKSEEAKCNLTTAITVNIVIPLFCGGVDLDERLSRAELEFLCQDIFNNITEPVSVAIEEAGLQPDDIDTIILVGGSSRIPYVTDALMDFFDNRIQPLSNVDPFEAVAIGAAIYCNKLENGEIISDLTRDVDRVTMKAISIVDVQPVSIGIKSGTNRFSKYIHRNEPLPQKGTFDFRTTQDNQMYASIEVLQGEDLEIDFANRSHISLGKFNLIGLPPKPAGQVIISVTMSVDESGILSVEAICEDAGIEKKLEINVTEVLSSDEMKEAIQLQQEMLKKKREKEK